VNGDLASRAPTVTVDAGALSGSVDTASGILVFRGIPYAAPPVGDRRWRAPAPLEHWSGVRAADRLGKNCVQAQPYSDIDPFAAGVSEDCLYLNVWTTGLDAGAKRPVMVWIYWRRLQRGLRWRGAAQRGASRAERRRRRQRSTIGWAHSGSLHIRRSPRRPAVARATMAFSIRSRRCSGSSATSRNRWGSFSRHDLR